MLFVRGEGGKNFKDTAKMSRKMKTLKKRLINI